MKDLPHDVADLYLAPVVLEVEGRIDGLGILSDEKLALQIGIESDRPDWSPELRRDALLRTIEHLVELHTWTLSWDERGIRVSHGRHSIVLGLPANCRRYIEGA